MSTAAVIPPPSSSSLLRFAPRLTARARALLTAMNLHFAGLAGLAVVSVYLLVRLVLVWQAAGASNGDALASQRASLRAAQIAALPLRGLDEKLLTSNEQADRFYAARLPYAYSQISAELGALATRHNVRLARVQYLPSPLLSGSDALSEVRLDVSVSGDYRPVVEFINAVERDRMFLSISGINLTGQQTGQVNLRLRMTTYLREPEAGELGDQAPPPAAGADQDSGAGGPQ